VLLVSERNAASFAHHVQPFDSLTAFSPASALSRICVSAYIIDDAERSGALRPGGCVCEGTGGNTGVALAMAARARGMTAMLALPASIVEEKKQLMKTLGAEVIETPPVPFTDPRHYFHVAREFAAAGNARDGEGSHFFTNQFENLSNALGHYEGTAPEIWQQVKGKLDAFVCAAGTGGTISGVSRFLKDRDEAIRVVLCDPLGSGLHDYVRSGQQKEAMEAVQAATGRGEAYEGVGDGRDLSSVTWLPRSDGGSICEGVGIGRLTANFVRARIDDAVQVTDEEVVDMAYHLLREDGVFIGPSSALNVVGAVKVARQLGPGHTVVTIICDGGSRYTSKLFNDDWLADRNLVVPSSEASQFATRD
jgi:cysteine synthase A